MGLNIHAKPVALFGKPIGNLWDIYVDCVFHVRVTYHGASLVRIKAKPRGYVSQAPSTEEMEKAIDKAKVE